MAEEYDGLASRPFMAHVCIGEDCREIWWSRLEAANASACEHPHHFRSCETVDFLYGPDRGVMVMPRRDDMRFVKSTGPMMGSR